MMNDSMDLLQEKIDKARAALPEATQRAINSVDWKSIILSLRDTRGFTFEQLGDLEIETELVLSGLLEPSEYPAQLEKRMGISKSAANELVNEMSNLVFKKIREELIKNIGRVSSKNNEEIHQGILSSAGIEIIDKEKPQKEEKIESKEVLPAVDLPAEPSVQLMQAGKLEIAGVPEINKAEVKKEVTPVEKASILSQKFSDSFKVPAAKTEYSLNNISKVKSEEETPVAQPKTQTYPPNGDPYRLSPED